MLPGLRMVTVLLPLETSIPTAFIRDTPLQCISNGLLPDLLIACSIYWVSHERLWFNLRKTNAANEGWLADLCTDVES